MVRAKYGAVFALRPYDLVDSFVLRCDYYESEIIEALRPFFGSQAVFWDVGANLGLHAVTAKLLAPETTVVAFEPSPREAARVRRHAELNRIVLQVEELALTVSGGERTLHIGNNGNSGMTTLHPLQACPYAESIKVTCWTAHELVAAGRAPAPTVMKIDVEGAEAEVLSGLGPLLGRPTLRAIVIEGDAGLENCPDTHPVATPLRAAGFQLSRLERREPTHHNLENYLAVRRA